MVVHRKNKTKSVYDTQGGRISFDEITMGIYSVYTAEVNNMIQKEIPMVQLFDMFGRDSVIKAEFNAGQNRCRLSVLNGNVYSIERSDGDCKIITYGEMKCIMESYHTGECVDVVLCASYDTQKSLTLVPYIYDMNGFSFMYKITRSIIVGLILAILVYAIRDTPVRDFMFLVFMLIKNNILPFVNTYI